MTRLTRLRQRAAESPLNTFFVVLFTTSALLATTYHVVYGSTFPGVVAIPYAWTPVLSAGATIWVCGESVRDWLGQLRTVRCGLHWYLAGIGLMMLGTEFETIVAVLLGADVTIPAYPLVGYLQTFLITLVLAGALEEFGWRGFLQPRLQQRFSAGTASVVVGVVWGLWHVPLILGGAGTFTVFWEYMLNVTAISVIFGWLYNNTSGALPAVMIAHAAHNMPPVGAPAGGVPAVFDAVSGDTMVYVCCAVLIALSVGTHTLTRDGTLPAVPGRLRKRLSRTEHLGD